MLSKYLISILALICFSTACYAIDVKAIKTNTSFEEVAHIDKLEQIKINEVPRTTYTPKNLRTQYMMSFQGRDNQNIMINWSNTFTDYDTKTIKSEIIDNTYYIQDNTGASFATGEHVDLTPINESINSLSDSVEENEKQINKNSKKIKQNSESIKRNTQSIQEVNQRIDSYAQDIDKVNDRVNSLERDIYSGLATVTALTSLHPNPRAEGPIELSIGTGVYRDQCAGAAGVFIHPTDNLMIQGGASVGNRNNYAGFVGLTFSFGHKK